MLLCLILGTFYTNSHGTNEREWKDDTGLPSLVTMLLCLLLGTFYANSCGTFKCANGDVYVGDWEDGKQHGLGTYKFVNGDVHVGDWEDGKQHGHGTYKYVNGDVYVGPQIGMNPTPLLGLPDLEY